MLILSIVMAAMAPVMTTRNKSDYSSPWRYSPSNSSDAYFGVGDSQVALLGQADVGDAERDTKLLIRTAAGSGFSHLLFKTGDTIVGRLYLDEDNLFLSNNNNPGGSKNTAIGVGTLTNANDDSENNTAIGSSAMSALTSGKYNVAIGNYSLARETTGEGNTAIGYDSMRDKLSGNQNTSIGYRANYDESGTHNMSGATAIGSLSRSFGNSSTAIGITASAAGTCSIAIGSETIASNQYSIAIGDESKTYGDYSLALGPYLTKAYGENSIAIGNEAHAGSSDTTSTNSIAIGSTAFSSANAIAIGTNSRALSGHAISIGTYSNSQMNSSDISNGVISIGSFAQALGTQSIAIGSGTYSSVAADWTEASGLRALAIGPGSVATKDYSIALGDNAEASGIYSIAIGGYASQPAVASGGSSVAIGRGTEAGSGSVAIGFNAKAIGDRNIAIGQNACSNVTGSNKVCIGAYSGPSRDGHGADSKNIIYLGTSDSIVYIPGNLIVDGNVGLGLLDGGVKVAARLQSHGGDYALLEADAGRYVRFSDINRYGMDTLVPFDQAFNVSDRRLKYVGQENTSGLDKIRQLKVFNYTFKKDEKKTPHVGVIAQDLQKIFPDAVKKGVDGFLSIRMEDMFYAVINAIKELDAKYQAQEKRINELEQRVEKLEAKLK